MNGSGRRGINLAGLEGGYGTDGPGNADEWHRSEGPRAGMDYPLHAPELIDYYFSRGIRIIRLLFSWERMQSQLWGSVPDPLPGYAQYFANFKQIVDYATSLGVTVIIEPWQAGPDGGVGGAVWRGQVIGEPPHQVDRYAFADFWAKLASIFKGNALVEYGLVNEPHAMSTMSWWTTAQKCVDYIRTAGATTNIYIPGNGYTAASSWTDESVDTGPPPRHSNAYGWLNVNDGMPIYDPIGKSIAEVHVYLDSDGSGNGDDIVSATIARERLEPGMNEANAQGYSMFIGEIGFCAATIGAQAAWDDFIDYTKHSAPACRGFTWWAGGWPTWWNDVHGPHFSVSPTDGKAYIGDTVNMALLRGGL